MIELEIKLKSRIIERINFRNSPILRDYFFMTENRVKNKNDSISRNRFEKKILFFGNLKILINLN
jgi:hypothetical protein